MAATPDATRVRPRKFECQPTERTKRTSNSVLEDKHQGSIVDPLDLEASALVLPFSKGGLDVAGFELWGEAGEGEDASHCCRQGHDLKMCCEVVSKRREVFCEYYKSLWVGRGGKKKKDYGS